MAALEKSVVHLSMRLKGAELAIGTGFFYERHGKLFIVTAWHNVTGRHSETLACQDKMARIPDSLLVTLRMRINKDGREAGWAFPVSVTVPLAGNDHALFYIHPQEWPRVDVVAIPFDPESVDAEFYAGDVYRKQPLRSLFPALGNGELTFECCPFQQFSLPDHKLEQQWLNSADVTEELFIPGYPENIQAQHTRPVWKRATIASSVQERLDDQPKFLIDSASHKGMSGSPVVFYSPSGTVQIGGVTSFLGCATAILVGVYVGRVGVKKDIDPQIGTVWHRSVIDQIIDGQRFERLSDDIEASPMEREVATKAVLRELTKEQVDSIKDSKSIKFVVQRKIMQDLSGRASPIKVLDELAGIAETYSGPYAADQDASST